MNRDNRDDRPLRTLTQNMECHVLGRRLLGMLILIVGVALLSPVHAQGPDSGDGAAGIDVPRTGLEGAATSSGHVRAGTRLVPPFVTRVEPQASTPDGASAELSSEQLNGITMELWRFIEGELGFETTFRERSIDGLLRGVADGEFDVAVAALTVTAQRAEDVDFTHPYFSTGSGIAVMARGNPVWAAFQAFFSLRFLLVIAVLAGLLALVGAALWWFERKRNHEQFGGSAVQGVGAGFWWAAVTMTTVGYGDKAPATLGGRVVALVWMFAALILISTFTAAIATTLTVSSLDTGVQNLADLDGKRVATVAGSSTESWLVERGHIVVPHASLGKALAAVRDGVAQAAAHDAPLLRYAIREAYAGELEVLDFEFLRQDYAFALPRGSALRVPMNQAILEFLESENWQRVLRQWLGNY